MYVGTGNSEDAFKQQQERRITICEYLNPASRAISSLLGILSGIKYISPHF